MGRALSAYKAVPGLRKAALALLATLTLAACADESPYAADGTPQPGLTAEEAASIARTNTSATEGQRFLSGATALSISGDYGTQIEYLSADGSSDLWFPGSGHTTPGHWKVVDTSSGAPNMCFLYGANSYDPVEHSYGGSWECAPLMRYLMNLQSLANGDPFRLASGKVPFVMPRGAAMTLDQAQHYRGTATQLDQAMNGRSHAISQAPLHYRFNRAKVPAPGAPTP